MAFISMVFAALFIVGAILLGIGFIGLIITIVSVRKRKRTPEGVKKKKAGLIVGIILMCVPMVPVVLILIYSAYSRIALEIQRANYTCITDEWRNEYVSEEEAAKEAMEVMLKAADEGDAEKIKKMFRHSASEKLLEKQIEQFLATCPKGLSKCDIPENFFEEYSCDYSKLDGERINDNELEEDYFSVYYEVEIDGEWYYISMEGCHRNVDNPEKVGIELFTVETGEAYVTEENYETTYLEFDATGDADIDMRRIDGNPYEFKSVNRNLNLDEILHTIDEELDYEEFMEEYGEANVGDEYAWYDEGEYIYELPSENGEARYLKFYVEDGEIILFRSCICGTEKGNEIWLDEFWKDEFWKDKFQKDKFQKEKNEISGDEEREQ